MPIQEPHLYTNPEEIEIQAKDNKYVETVYTGDTPTLKGKKGVAYFNAHDDRWYFSPTKVGQEPDWYRVKVENLDLWEG
jgi:hypothetical protein